jgi:hypothetical protein
METVVLTLKFALSMDVFVIAMTGAALVLGTTPLVQNQAPLLGRVREGSAAALATVSRGR